MMMRTEKKIFSGVPRGTPPIYSIIEKGFMQTEKNERKGPASNFRGRLEGVKNTGFMEGVIGGNPNHREDHNMLRNPTSCCTETLPTNQPISWLGNLLFGLFWKRRATPSEPGRREGMGGGDRISIPVYS